MLHTTGPEILLRSRYDLCDREEPHRVDYWKSRSSLGQATLKDYYPGCTNTVGFKVSLSLDFRLRLV